MNYRKWWLSAAFFAFSAAGFAQEQLPASEASTAEQMRTSRQQKGLIENASVLKQYPVRNIGPVVQGARITDIAVKPGNNKVYYVAYASGGVFKTQDAGITFQPVFDDQGAFTIGDIALAPSADEIFTWVQARKTPAAAAMPVRVFTKAAMPEKAGSSLGSKISTH